jgi:hypothetical protein
VYLPHKVSKSLSFGLNLVNNKFKNKTWLGRGCESRSKKYLGTWNGDEPVVQPATKGRRDLN